MEPTEGWIAEMGHKEVMARLQVMRSALMEEQAVLNLIICRLDKLREIQDGCTCKRGR